MFTFLILFSPIAYISVSLVNDKKRTDFLGKEIARLVQDKWDNNFINEIKIVVGDEWYAEISLIILIQDPFGQTN